MKTRVTAGLKCAPEIAYPKRVMIHIPRSIPHYSYPISIQKTPRAAVPTISTKNFVRFTRKYCLMVRFVLFRLPGGDFASFSY